MQLFQLLVGVVPFANLALCKPSGDVKGAPNHQAIRPKQIYYPRETPTWKRSVDWPAKSAHNDSIPFAANTSTTHGPGSRSAWSSGFDVETDFYQRWPVTGVTRNYHLTVTNTTCNPDGLGQVGCLLINNQLPGPTLEADWGDTIRVTVTNHMQDNGTSTHFHGIRLLNENAMDGVNGITECPLAPGETKTYTWTATQYGTTWYHSHHSVQYGAGVMGPIVINGPTSANYDVDLGPLVISDWYQNSVYDVEHMAYQNAFKMYPPPNTTSILMNGMSASGGDAKPWETFVEQGRTYKLRLVNTAVDTVVRFSIDGHSMTVVAMDLVPIEPYSVDTIMVGIAQRYDIIFTANQTVDNYYMRAVNEPACRSAFNDRDGISILRYQGASNSTAPTSQAHKGPDDCLAPASLVPIVKSNPGTVEEFKKNFTNIVFKLENKQVDATKDNLILWNIDFKGPLTVDWSKPTYSFIQEQNNSYPETEKIFEIPSHGQWTYWLFQNLGNYSRIAHPFHLHGHDFYILGQGFGPFDPSYIPSLNFDNPVRRDTHYMPPNPHENGTWNIIAFKADNPGAWLLHCHVADHIGGGLGVQFLEGKDQIVLPGDEYTKECQAWDKYYDQAFWKQDDSGL